MDQEKFFCEECGKTEMIFIGNDWARFAFSDEQYAWIYQCQNCQAERAESQPL